MAAYFAEQDADGTRADDAQARRQAPDGLQIERYFSEEGACPFDEVTWERRPATIKDENGEPIFHQDDVEVPSQWSQLATNVVTSKYFYGPSGSPEREGSVRDLVHRVTRTITDWAHEDGVFAGDADAEVFYNELTWLCVNQYGAFNSPVWFNVGLYHQKGVPGSKGNFHWDPKTHTPTATHRGY